MRWINQLCDGVVLLNGPNRALSNDSSKWNTVAADLKFRRFASDVHNYLDWLMKWGVTSDGVRDHDKLSKGFLDACGIDWNTGSFATLSTLFDVAPDCIADATARVPFTGARDALRGLRRFLET